MHSLFPYCLCLTTGRTYEILVEIDQNHPFQEDSGTEQATELAGVKFYQRIFITLSLST